MQKVYQEIAKSKESLSNEIGEHKYDTGHTLDSFRDLLHRLEVGVNSHETKLTSRFETMKVIDGKVA